MFFLLFGSLQYLKDRILTYAWGNLVGNWISFKLHGPKDQCFKICFAFLVS